MSKTFLTELRDQIKKRFDLEELRSLCFDLSIPYDDVAGTTLDSKTVALISYCLRRELIDQLLARCKELRPLEVWPSNPTGQIRNLSEIRELAKGAYNRRRLIDLERYMVEAKILAQNSSDDSTNDILEEIEGLRGSLRMELGRPSTLVTNEAREMYKKIQQLLSEYPRFFIDNQGIFGAAGEPVDLFVVLEWARNAYLNQVRDLCQQRIEQADLMTPKAPFMALRLMEETKAILDDEILNRDDRTSLGSISQLIDFKIAEIQRLNYS